MILNMHVSKWRRCTKCSLHKTRKKVALYRGELPCDVLFLGEAPGDSENILGKPFVGPAGKLLDKMINVAIQNSGKTPTVAFGNILGCIPRTEDRVKVKYLYGYNGLRAWAKQCQPRVEELVRWAQPTVVVCVGKVAVEYLPKLHSAVQTVAIAHPAAMLQMDIAGRGLAIQRATYTLSDTFVDCC